MMASIDEDVEKISLADQDDVRNGASSSGQNKSRKYYDSSGSITFESITEEERSKFECVTLSSKSSKSGDHRRSRRDLPVDDRREADVDLKALVQIDIFWVVKGPD
nr:DNA/RNA helicase, DEAD/DEAH box type, N-terminal [Tanacetum cinerariifolium]